MAQKNEVFSQTIKHKGYFNFSDLYGYVFDWLGDNGFGVNEKEYTEKVSANGKEIQITWETGKGISDYMKHTIKVSWHIIGMKDAEVEQDGRKVSTNKGDLKIKITAEMVRDPDDNWEKTPFWKMMRGIYDKYIIKTTVSEYEGRLKDKAKSLAGEIKSFLQLSAK